MVIIKTGDYYKLFSMNVNGVEYYFISGIEDGGFIWVFNNAKQAEQMFEIAELQKSFYEEE